ncbi:MAG: hypothetical protein MSF32_02585, partial [Dysosmobacter sp.]|nr:hypothetical protein [Dysosmobacter sp.]
CRCAAQTPAGTGFLQAFDPIRGGSRPLVLPLQKRTLFLQAGFFDKLKIAGTSVPAIFLPLQPMALWLFILGILQFSL